MRAFLYIEKWVRAKKADEPFGFFYRVGVKDVNFGNNRHENALLYFVVPYSNEGLNVNERYVSTLNERISELIHNSYTRLSEMCETTVVVVRPPPDYMLNEILQLLPH